MNLKQKLSVATKSIFAICAITALVVGCGGGGGSSTTQTTNTTGGSGTGTGSNAFMQPLNLLGNVTTYDSYTVGVTGGLSPYRFTSLLGLVESKDGYLYVPEPANSIIREVGLNGVVSVFAGQVNMFGYGVVGSQNGVGTSATFNQPQFITIDPSDTNLYVTDSLNCNIRKIVILTQEVSLLAGDAIGTCGFKDGQYGQLKGPSGITISPDGNWIYVSDYYNNAIRKVEIATHNVTTIAGGGPSGWADGTGNNAQFDGPEGITTDGTNLFVADTNSQTIRQIVIATGAVTTLAGVPYMPGSNNGVGGLAQFWGPAGVLTDGKYVYVSETANNAIRKIEIATRVVTTLAGQVTTFNSDGSPGTPGFGAQDGFGTSAQFYYPTGLAFQWSFDGSHVVGLLVADTGNHSIRQIF